MLIGELTVPEGERIAISKQELCGGAYFPRMK